VPRLVLSFALAVCAFGADWSKLKPEGYISDFARVVDAESRASIDAYLTALERDTGAQIAIVTIDTLDGEMVDEVANKLYRQFGVGVKGKNEGALFLLVVKDRKSRLEVGYGLEAIVPDGVAGDILRSMRPALRAEQYGPGLVEASRVLGTKIAAGKNVTLTGQLPEKRRFDQEPIRPTVAQDERTTQILIGVGVLIVLVLMSRSRGGRRGRGTWILPSGGGFGGGGGSGGSSWGGFGGGDSGGGGASSDW
jgi:uncharacterized protein